MQGFLHCVWPPKMSYLAAEGGGGGEKKSQQAHGGSRQRTGCPNKTTVEEVAFGKCHFRRIRERAQNDLKEA